MNIIKDSKILLGDFTPELINTGNEGESIAEVRSKLRDLEQKIEESEQRILTDKATLVAVFGVFATIITFVSVEIQVFRLFSNYQQIIGFSFFFLAALLIFNLVLHHIAQSWISNNSKKELRCTAGILFILLVLGVGFMCFGNKALQQPNLNDTSTQIELIVSDKCDKQCISHS